MVWSSKSCDCNKDESDIRNTLGLWNPNNHCCDNTALSHPQSWAQRSSCSLSLSGSEIWLSHKSTLVASWLHLHTCRWLQEHLRMIFLCLRGRWLAPWGPGSIWNHLGSPARSTRGSGRCVCCFLANLHLLMSWPKEVFGIRSVLRRGKSISQFRFYVYFLNWQTNLFDVAAMDIETAEYHQDNCNCILMLRFVLADIRLKTISYAAPRCLFNAWQSEIVWHLANTPSNICRREYILPAEAIKKQLLSRNKVSLPLDSWRWMDKIKIVLVFA